MKQKVSSENLYTRSARVLLWTSQIRCMRALPLLFAHFVAMRWSALYHVLLHCLITFWGFRVCRMNFDLRSNANGFNVGAIGGGPSTDGEEDSPTMGRD